MPPPAPVGRLQDDLEAKTTERQLLGAQMRAGVPITLLFVGGVYAVLAGTIFFFQINGPLAAALWAATAALGLALVGVGWLMRRSNWSLSAISATSSLLASVVILHALGFLWATHDPGQSPYILMLLVGAGYLLLNTSGLLAVDAVAVVGWALVSRSLGIPFFDARGGGLVLAGVAIGLVAHFLRRRAIAASAANTLATQGTLQASEERFRTLAETAKDAILILEGDGRLSYLNPAGMTLFGLRSTDLGRPAGHLLGPAGNDPARLVGTTELVAQRMDGSTFPAELSLSRTERQDGTVYTGILRDTTERKRAAEASQAAAARETELETLRKMNSFKTNFLNTAAHELNTPLTPLRLQLHLLKSESMGALNDKQSKAIGLLDRNVARLSGLVGEILEVARLQSGRVRLTAAPVEVDAVVDEVIESFNETARRVGVGLAFEGSPGLVAHADRNRFTQILFNLVSNALKFTPAGGSVTVEAHRTGSLVSLRVRDTGLGLTDEQIGRLFQPFSQVHDPMAVPATGTGLGLYICKGLAEAQGGSITCSSPGPGRGSMFTFTLPAEAGGVPAGPMSVEPVVTEEDPMVRRLRELI